MKRYEQIPDLGKFYSCTGTRLMDEVVARFEDLALIYDSALMLEDLLLPLRHEVIAKCKT